MDDFQEYVLRRPVKARPMSKSGYYKKPMDYDVPGYEIERPGGVRNWTNKESFSHLYVPLPDEPETGLPVPGEYFLKALGHLSSAEIEEREKKEEELNEKECCLNCVFFLKGRSLCRESSPKIGGFPYVSRVDWCGDYCRG